MKLFLKNIGPIKDSVIEMNGITVIAGENDTGKSTVSKTMYSVITSFNNYEMDYKDALSDDIMDKLKTQYNVIRRSTGRKLNDNIMRNFIPLSFWDKAIRPTLEKEDSTSLELYKQNVATNLKLLKEDNVEEQVYAKIENEYMAIEKILTDVSDESLATSESIRALLNSEFQGQICNDSEEEYEIRAEENGEISFIVAGNNMNEITKVIFKDSYYNDSVYIESPYTLQLNDFLVNKRNKFTGIDVPRHTEELLQRLRAVKRKESTRDYLIDLLETEEYFSLLKTLGDMIQGNMYFDKDKGRFEYVKTGQGDKNYKLNNIANGIKHLGILQMLLQGRMIGNRSLIIMDEPEVHLHPKWQIELAEALVKLVSVTNNNILINTHSPYFLNALQAFGKKYNLQNKEKYYLAKKVENHAEMEDCTDSIDKIYAILFEPFQRLIDIENELDIEDEEE